MELKLLVTDKEAAAMFSMGRSTFWDKVNKGMLPQPIKIGGVTRWRVADLQACIAPPASQPTTASEPVSA